MFKKLLVFVCSLGLVLAACAAPAAPAIPAATATEAFTATVTPVATAMETPKPTVTPTPTQMSEEDCVNVHRIPDFAFEVVSFDLTAKTATFRAKTCFLLLAGNTKVFGATTDGIWWSFVLPLDDTFVSPGIAFDASVFEPTPEYGITVTVVESKDIQYRYIQFYNK